MKTESVHITRAVSYEPDEVKHGLETLLAPMGGLANFIAPGERVLYKVNLLSPKPPEQAVTTHPTVVKALCEMTRELGAYPVVGDSAGGMTAKGSRTEQAFEVSGIREAAEQGGGEAVNFDQQPRIKLDGHASGLEGELYIAEEIQSADKIVCVPKLKTHGYTYFTGAIKNMYGVLPGRQKRELHRHFASIEQFSEMLADLYFAVKPHLNIMDGIVGMEGNGPSGGDPRHVGLLLASTDGVALDEIACQLIGYQPLQVNQIQIAHSKGYGQGDAARIQLPGPLKDYQPDTFELPVTRAIKLVPPFLTRFVMTQFRVRPVINQARCTRCGICFQNCPVDTINRVNRDPGQEPGPNFFYRVDPAHCIECLCCHELCPENAIDLPYRGTLAQLYTRIRRL